MSDQHNELPDIIVSNDDGISAPGIQHLVRAASRHGKLTIVAPDSPQSGMGHAISIGKPLRTNHFRLSNGHDGIACSGTPADCVKFATGMVLHHKPQLLVSGINHGANSSVAVFYSGTMSAAVEGAIEGIPSIGFSLCNYDYDADFTAAEAIADQLIAHALKHPLPQNTALNVNIPNLPLEMIKGIRITRQSIGRWIEEFDKRVDPAGRPYYWLTGKFFTEDLGEDTDEWALRNGYVSVCPVHVDITAYHAMSALNAWKIKLD